MGEEQRKLLSMRLGFLQRTGASSDRATEAIGILRVWTHFGGY